VTDDARGRHPWSISPWILVVLLSGVLVGACGQPGGSDVMPGCLGTGGKDVPATVGQPVELTATVSIGSCPDFPAVAQDDDLFKNEIAVGDLVQVRLVAPLLPVRVQPVTAEVQRLEPGRPEARWRWQLVADEPGLHRLSLVATVVDTDGKVLLENRPIEVRLHATATTGWYMARAWAGVTAFVMSAQGVVVGIAAIASAAGGTWLARRRARSAQIAEAPAAPERDRDRSGYL
jgi:hypothetical protein